MAKVHKYDLSRRLDNGKWEVVGKGYRDSQSGRITLWVNPEKMRKIIKGQNDDVPFILFDKDPAPVTEPVKKAPAPQHTAGVPASPHQAPPVYLTPGAVRTKHFEPKAQVPPPTVAKPSDSWPPDFDDDIPF